MKIKSMMAAASVLALAAAPAFAGTFEKTATGIVVHPDTGTAKDVRLEVMSPSIIHVLAVDDPRREQVPSLMTVATPNGSFTVRTGKTRVTLDAGKARAEVD